MCRGCGPKGKKETKKTPQGGPGAVAWLVGGPGVAGGLTPSPGALWTGEPAELAGWGSPRPALHEGSAAAGCLHNPPPPRFWGLVVTSAVLSPGRVSFFTSGSENLHRVEKVHWGTRYAVTIAFTCNPDHGIADPALTPPGGPSAQPR